MAQSDTVIVGCRYPNGLDIHIDRMAAVRTPAWHQPNGFTEVQVATPIQTIKLAGPNRVNRFDGEGPYAFTTVPRKFWEQWIVSHRNDPAIVNKQIIVGETRDELRGLARDAKEFKSGLQPVDAKQQDARMPKIPGMKGAVVVEPETVD
jgi:hypothetical protein